MSDSHEPAGAPEDGDAGTGAEIGERPGWRRSATRALVTLGAVVLVCVVGLALLIGPVLGLVARAVDIEHRGEEDDLPTLADRSVIVDAAGETLAVVHGAEDRRLVPLADVPDHVRGAILAAEDRRFYDHGGYDSRAIVRALVANLRAGEVEQGASTITQQVARHAFLDREQTIQRKLHEVAYAVALEEHLEKDEILERYLNAVYFGSGAYGIAAAAEQYFRAEPDELTPGQAAMLAALIRAPERLNPRDDPDLVLQRRDWVLDAMVEEGFLEEEEAEQYRGEQLDIEPRLEREVAEPYAVEAVKREFARLDAFGDSPDERLEALHAGGFVVTTTIDRDRQRLAAEIVSAAFPEGDGPTAALVSLDPRDGAIRALHGGVDFEETQFDLATQGRRQPGSALKPFIALAALERGLSPHTAFDGNGPLPFATGGADGVWEVGNFGGGRHGTIDLAQATALSVNTAFAQLILAVGVEETIETLERLGVNAEAAFGEPDTWGPSIVLGGLTHGVTPLELAAAYGAFADQGRLGPPYLIERVENASGEVVYEREPTERKQVIDPGVNATMVDLLRGVVQGGTGAGAQIGGWEVLGKTGTTDGHTDAWFVGATATMSTAVWVGHPEGQVPMDGMTGGSVPAELWRQFTAAVLDGAEPLPFPDADVARETPAPDTVTVPDLTGLPVSEALVAAAEAGLMGVLADGDGGDPSRAIVQQQPAPGTEAAFGEPITLRFAAPAPPPEPEEEDAEGEEPPEEEGEGPPEEEGEEPPGQGEEPPGQGEGPPDEGEE